MSKILNLSCCRVRVWGRQYKCTAGEIIKLPMLTSSRWRHLDTSPFSAEICQSLCRPHYEGRNILTGD